MRAAFLEQLGAPDVIRTGDLPAPVPGPTDVLVNVACTTMNPVDALIRSGAYRTPIPFPFVVGRDLVGRVAAAGPGAPGFQEGDLVWCNSLGHDGRQGAAAQQAVVPAHRLYHLPDGVAPADAVTVLHPAATAYLALFVHGRVGVGQTVLVAGAAGNVGSAAVRMAADAGARVIATAAERDLAYCRELGASEVLDYGGAARYPDGIDLFVDTSGGNDLERAVEALAERGRIVLLAGKGTRPLPAWALFLKTASIHGFIISRATRPSWPPPPAR